MSAYAYKLVGKAKNVPTDYIPSLVAIDEQQIAATPEDIYFERVEVSFVNLNQISRTRWASYDSLPNKTRDPIVGLRIDGAALYIPLSDLRELAATAAEIDDAPAQELVKLFLQGERNG